MPPILGGREGLLLSSAFVSLTLRSWKSVSHMIQINKEKINKEIQSERVSFSYLLTHVKGSNQAVDLF